VFDKSIADVLDMSVDEGCEYFENISTIKTKLLTLKKVGLGYIKIGQQATTLSGGEAQRIKLAKELSKRSAMLFPLNLISSVSLLYLVPLHSSHSGSSESPSSRFPW
jgi:excinuclease UvrABC ATPase subunit